MDFKEVYIIPQGYVGYVAFGHLSQNLTGVLVRCLVLEVHEDHFDLRYAEDFTHLDHQVGTLLHVHRNAILTCPSQVGQDYEKQEIS